MRRLFAAIAANADERSAARAGDDLVVPADVVMDRAYTFDAPPERVWPWLVQLGKRRAGWYLPRSVERFVPASRRAVRSVDPRWQGLGVGDVIPDYGGRDETFRVAELHAPHVLVYTSQRGRVSVCWSLTLLPVDDGARTRLHLRLTLGPVRRKWLATTAGELLDAATIAGMVAGLSERLRTG
ncbi:hypothetical protein [uncultured Jatrophihabitans sp.]|uniref:hypothetical protein n=1 Tax=uncultured Jatrophihabitans sp. TaxID=1610747 RepID=UPI0035C9F575